MPIPLIPVAAGVGLAALLFAGKKETKPASSTSSGGAVTATPLSTSGDQGGALAPSHAGFEQTSQVADIPSSTIDDFVPTSPATSKGGSPVVSSTTPTQTTTDSSDPFAPTVGPSFVGGGPQPSTGGALGAIGTTAGMTTKAVGDAFATWGEVFGSIW